MHPFSEEEWEQRGGEKDEDMRDEDMSILGMGAFMTTYRMRNANGECFAVKAVERRQMKHQGITKEDVQREARTLQSLRHRHVIRYYRFYEWDRKLGLVMEWAKGGSLGDYMKARARQNQRTSMTDLIDIGIQLAAAMEYIHGEGVVHRDIKLDNVLLANAEGETLWIKLADFGVAARLTTTVGNSSNLHSKKGTDVYYSPERGEGAAYGRKADMWAVGCIVLELARGKRLEGSLWASRPEVTDRLAKCLAEVEDRSTALVKIVQGLLEKDQKRRMSAANLKVSLQDLALEVSGSAGAEGGKNKRAKTAGDARGTPSHQAARATATSAPHAEHLASDQGDGSLSSQQLGQEGNNRSGSESSGVRRSFDDIHVHVNFHSTATKLRLDPRLKIEKLDSHHKFHESARAFADIHGPVFHFSFNDGGLEDEVDVCFDIPITDGMCAQSLVLLRLPSDGGSWEVAGRGSFRRFFADGRVFLHIRTRSFSCFTWGCCTICAAFHCFRTTSGPTVKVIIYPKEVKFPFPREGFCADGGEMILDGFGVVQPANGSNPDVLLRVNEEFKIGFSFQRNDPSQIRFDLDKDTKKEKK